MCGIAGLAGGFVPGLMDRMNSVQGHRGPDSQGVFEDPSSGIALGHVRLSILDLSPAGSQPMKTRDGRHVLIFGGEIYNFRELREELVKRGRTFVSSSDTEVLLQGLVEFGADFLRRLNGMFSLAWWNGETRELLMARDPMGIKPLYYAELPGGALLFATEMKALIQHPGLVVQPDFIALHQHLTYSHASDERTAIASIRRVRPGVAMTWRAGRPVAQVPFWRERLTKVAPGGRAEATAELKVQLQEAVRRQMVADVPLGIMLSGGLDSSLVAALAAREAGSSLQCFTVSYAESDNIFDHANEDLAYSRAFASHLGVRLNEIGLQPDMAEALPRLVYHLDEPLADPAVFGSNLVCKLARESGIKVLLSGQGGDELFCGYPRYRAMHLLRGVDRLPSSVRQAVATGAGYLPGAWEGRSGALLRKARRVLVELPERPEVRFLDLCANTPQSEASRIWSPEVRRILGDTTFRDDCLAHMAANELQGLPAMQDRDLAIYLANHNLNYTDKTSMAEGVEARVPLLDLEIVRRAIHYPYDWLLGKTTKVLLRDAARGIVPDSIIDRSKAGFGAPYRKWLRYDLAPMWEELTSVESVKNRGWFDHAALQDARRRSQAGKDDLYLLQWAVLVAEIWARQFIDRRGRSVS